MIDFDLTEEHRLLEQSVREWGAREIAPRIRELDRAHRFDKDILPQMADLGLLGISVPVEYGGAGMDYISLGIISEELEYLDTSLRVIMSVHAGLNCLSLLTWGTEAQKQQYLVPQAQGKKIATYGLTEPAAGSTRLSASPGVVPIGSPPSMKIGMVADGVTLKVSLPAWPSTRNDSLSAVTGTNAPTVTMLPSMTIVSPADVPRTSIASLAPLPLTVRAALAVNATTGFRLFA